MDTRKTHLTDGGKVEGASFGTRIREERVRRSWSQATLARRAKIRPARMSRLERGLVEPRLSELLKIAGALDTKLDALVSGGTERVEGGHSGQGGAS